MSQYQKIYVTKSKYNIIYNSDTGTRKKVAEDQDLYLKWIAKNNIPKEIAYVKPTKTQLIIRASRVATNIKKSEYNINLWEASKEYTALQTDLSNIDDMTKIQLQNYLGV